MSQSSGIFELFCRNYSENVATISKSHNDIYYLEHWSVWMDLKIIFLTPVALIQNKNVF
ncbi:hypothetical protein MIZ03_2157 [Rhodoferax lithotrophicus]|uniref:Bacterial sugar transferase domain-containing protein n=1 Tax=Rhodoferax lithotrophicus TaxID=2798804 RepID=A0ABN6D5K6_9BURK|nr:hypothetical protein MIZ03_2157 [Rhodoferax sp. MIZ03]